MERMARIAPPRGLRFAHLLTVAVGASAPPQRVGAMALQRKGTRMTDRVQRPDGDLVRWVCGFALLALGALAAAALTAYAWHVWMLARIEWWG